MNTTAGYDAIGVGYSKFRRPDPRIERAIRDALGPSRRVVNVGAGSGSYEPDDRSVVAVEPSPEMIRQRPHSAAPCVRGRAADLPFRDGEFDTAMAVLTVHHWPDQEAGLRELRRVASGVVILTFEPAVHNDFWLFRDYIPAIGALRSTSGLGVDDVAGVVDADRVEPVLVPHDCTDGFGCAYWRRPEAYLESDVRRCISALALADPSAVTRGIEALGDDLRSGVWHERYGDLLGEESFDGGLRLVVRDPR